MNNISQSDISAVYRIEPVAANPLVASTAQTDAERAINQTLNQSLDLVAGKQYVATVLAQTPSANNSTPLSNNFIVDIAGQKLNILLKPAVGDSTDLAQAKPLQVGQKINLAYIGGVGGTSPPRFALLEVLEGHAASTLTHIGQAAQIIQQSLQFSLEQPRIMAQKILTQQPQNPEFTAQQFKAAMVNSGVFYESHLAQFVQGDYTIQALKLEPQNSQQQSIQQVLPQQLEALENQHFNWVGQVWAGQTMAWDVWAKPISNQAVIADNEHSAAADTEQTTQNITSQLTLELPNLGRISIRLECNHAKVRVNMQAEAPTTSALLKQNSANLISNMQQQGRVLESLLVS